MSSSSPDLAWPADDREALSPQLSALLITLSEEYPRLSGRTVWHALGHSTAVARAMTPGAPLDLNQVGTLVRELLDALSSSPRVAASAAQLGQARDR